MAVIDLNGNIQYVNKAFAAIHGYRPNNLIGKHISIFHAPDQMPAVRESIEQIKKTGLSTGEIWHSRKDGSAFPTLMQNTILKDEKGRAVGMIGTIRDISDLKQAQKELSEYRNQLENMVKNKIIELQKANKTMRKNLKKKLTKIKKFSSILEEQKAAVERKNITLQEILEQLHREKKQIKKDVIANVENMIIPVIQRIKIGSNKKEKREFVILEQELKNLTSSFGRTVSDKKLRLTPREIEICDMIRNGLTSNEIARLLYLSSKTVDGHRNRIRNKLGIRNKKYNLASVLQHL